MDKTEERERNKKYAEKLKRHLIGKYGEKNVNQMLL